MNEKIQKLKKDRTDKRYLDVMGFLVAKGLLFTNRKTIVPKPTVKIDLMDALWAGENVEPRILEVLPAALIHFPKTFFNTRKIPKELALVVDQIERGELAGNDYQWVKYGDMLRWANLQLPDRRTKPIKEQKLLRSYRFSQNTLERIERLSNARGVSHTELLERLVEEG